MTIKEWLGEKAIYDPGGQIIFADPIGDGSKLQIIADIRGWGAIQNLFKNKDQAQAANFQDQLGQFITDAINEKLSREKNT